jgi:mRNA interferase MazF
LVVSANQLNHGPAELALVVPITSREKGIRFHVRIDPPEGGLERLSFLKPEDVRSVSLERLVHRRGTVSPVTLVAVDTRLRVLLEL